MKLVRWGAASAEQAGLVDATGILRDLSSAVADWSWQTLTPETLAQVSAVDTDTLPTLPAETRLGAPVFRPGKIVGCALTYGKHAADTAWLPLDYPDPFGRSASVMPSSCAWMPSMLTWLGTSTLPSMRKHVVPALTYVVVSILGTLHSCRARPDAHLYE